MLKSKKDALNKQAKLEIANLLRAGKDELARIKSESLAREDYHIEALEILETFCELLLARIPQIQAQRSEETRGIGKSLSLGSVHANSWKQFALLSMPLLYRR